MEYSDSSSKVLGRSFPSCSAVQVSRDRGIFAPCFTPDAAHLNCVCASLTRLMSPGFPVVTMRTACVNSTNSTRL